MPVVRTTFGLLACALIVTLAPVFDAAARDKPKIEVVPQIGHSANVGSVAFSPDGRQVLSGSLDSTLKLWDVASGTLIRTFVGHSHAVSSVAFSPDGRQVLSGSWDKTLKLWDVPSGAILQTFEGHSGWVHALAVSPDGHGVLSAGEDKTLKLWDVASGTLLRTFEGHRDTVRSVAFSPDGRRVLSGSVDKTLKLWDVASGALLRTFEGHSETMSVAFSPDGGQLLSGSVDKTLKVWDSTSSALLRTFEGHSEAVVAAVFLARGKQILSGSWDKTLKLWDVASGALLRTIEGHSGWVQALAVSPDGRQAMSGGADNTLKLWDAASSVLLRTLDGKSHTINSVTFSPDGRQVLSGGDDKTLKLWDAGSGALLRTFQGGHLGRVTSAAFSPDGRHVLSGGGEGSLNLWDATSGALLHTINGRSCQAVAFSPDGRQVLGGGDEMLKLWDAGSGVLVRSFEGHSGWIKSVAFSPDGRQVLAGGEEILKLWDAGSGAPLLTFEGHSALATSVAFSPDGRQVLSADQNNVLKVWDAASGALMRTFEGHLSRVWSVAFSPDGAKVLSGSEDGTLKLWDTASAALLRTFKGHSGGVSSVTFSPNGLQLLSGGYDSKTRVWSTATGQTLASFIATPKGEWLAITEQGFFGGSATASDKMVSVVRGLDITTILQVHQSLFNPDLVRAALAGDPGDEVADAAKFINLERVLDSGPAPTVTIINPVKDIPSRSDLLTVQIRVTDRGKGVGRIEWRVNGITASVRAKPAGRGPDYVLTQKLALDPGDNIIEVVAYNGNDLLASLPARTTIKFTGAADGTKPKLHVLAIGINTYKDGGWKPSGQSETYAFPPLALAVKDAIAFGDSLRQAAGGLYADVRLTTLTDTQATRKGLRAAIDKIAADVHPRDTFILFAAAHGKSEAGRFYLIPQDYDGGPNPEALATRAIDQSILQDWLANRIKAKKAVILLDTCESGALVAGYARSRTDTPTSEAALGRLHEATGRPVLTAAAEGNPAFEGYEGHGVFTWALLDALKNGDRNGNGTIELSELVAHVQDQVPKIAAKLNGIGRAAIAVRGSTDGSQSARFGSKGEDFPLTQRLH